MIDWAIIREKTEKEKNEESEGEAEEEEEEDREREKVPPSLTSRPLVIREFFAHMRLYAYYWKKEKKKKTTKKREKKIEFVYKHWLIKKNVDELLSTSTITLIDSNRSNNT